MIVVLVLSKANHLTSAFMGPNGLGSIAKEITEDFPTGTPLDKSALILLGPGPLRDDAAGEHRGPRHRQSGERALMDVIDRGSHRRCSRPPRRSRDRFAGSGPERPAQPTQAHHRAGWSSRPVGSAVAALALVWVVFAVAGITAPFGMLVCWYVLFFAIYGVSAGGTARNPRGQGPYGHLGDLVRRRDGHGRSGRGHRLRDPQGVFRSLRRLSPLPHGRYAAFRGRVGRSPSSGWAPRSSARSSRWASPRSSPSHSAS